MYIEQLNCMHLFTLFWVKRTGVGVEGESENYIKYLTINFYVK